MTILYTLGLRPSLHGTEPTLHASLFIISNFALSFLILGGRLPRIALGFDHNSAPRDDVAKYGEAMLKEGKITVKQLNRIKRWEAAYANSVENFPLFFGAMLFMIQARLPSSTINSIGAVYTLARIGYSLAYVLIEDDTLSVLRSLMWWTGNMTCVTAIVKAGNAL